MLQLYLSTQYFKLAYPVHDRGPRCRAGMFWNNNVKYDSDSTLSDSSTEFEERMWLPRSKESGRRNRRHESRKPNSSFFGLEWPWTSSAQRNAKRNKKRERKHRQNSSGVWRGQSPRQYGLVCIKQSLK